MRHNTGVLGCQGLSTGAAAREKDRRKGFTLYIFININIYMKTLIDIPIETLGAVQKLYSLRTKKAAIVFALNEVIRYKKLQDMAAKLGTLEDDDVMSQSKLRHMRRNDTTRIFSVD